ncbi:hypothetical protein AVEN_236673-1 [Araneus ventricosus]|uniref:Uncharacterized protein n=1 Tax=Araneus ventricosus TaxID=182803 RepID=A0A4Y2LIA8_ARAVE|nr:hypothetical protein AVEN_236673-1 [Araneus ventricosus]
MKPESIKNILRSYLKERQYSSSYDDIDGIGCPEYMSGESFDSLEGRANGTERKSPTMFKAEKRKMVMCPNLKYFREGDSLKNGVKQ